MFPKLIESKFTSEMENSLDAIASGTLEWQRYFIDWERDYFASALEKAHHFLQITTEGGQTSSQSLTVKRISSRSTKSSSIKLNSKAKVHSSLIITDKHCPACNSFLTEKLYIKNGEAKKMLVCSSGKRDHAHENVVYFFTKNNKWWSPKFGEL